MKRHTDKIHQIWRLITLLQTGQAGTAPQIAEKLNVATRTVHRYLKTLEEASIPCYFDKDSKSYKIRKDYFLPSVQLTGSETLAIALLVEEVAGKGQIAFTRQAISAIHKA